MLGGTTFSFGYATATKGDIFGMILDANGKYPGCYVNPVTLQTTNPGVTSKPLSLIASFPTLTARTAGTASSIALPVINAVLPSTNICAPITTAPESPLEEDAEVSDTEEDGE
jgi:hypothetical protein